MFYTAQVRKVVNGQQGVLELECAELAEDHQLTVPPVAELAVASLPQPGEDVLVQRGPGNSLHWIPWRPAVLVGWLNAQRSGLASPSRDVAVVLDDSDRTVRLAATVADQRVVLEGIKAVLEAIMDLVAGIPYGGSSGPGPALDGSPVAALLTAANQAVADLDSYTAQGVLAPKTKPTAGGGGQEVEPDAP